MAAITIAAADLPIQGAVGFPITIGLTITENSVAYAWAGATVTTSIVDGAGVAAPVRTWTFTLGVDGAATMSLSMANTTTLGVGTWRYQVSVSKAGVATPWLAGLLSIVDGYRGGASVASATLAVTTGPTTSLAITTTGPTMASGVSLLDAGNRYTATDVEGALSEIITAGALSRLQLGSPPTPAYLAEIYESDAALVADTSIVRVRGIAAASPTRVGQFWGLAGVRVDMSDQPGVIDGGAGVGTDPYLYGARLRMAPRVGRNNTGIDDVVGLAVVNGSFTDYGTVFNGTEAIYVGYSGGATKDWNAGLGIDTIADNGMYIARGPYQYGILMTGSVTTAALRIPNNSLIVARDAANSTNISILKVDASDRLSFKADAMVIDGSGNVLVNTTSPNLIAGGKGIQIRSTDGTAVELNASADTAASASSAVYAKGRSGSTDVVARMQANSSGAVNIGSESSHGLNLRMGGATKLTVGSAALTVVADPYDIILGATTGTKIGTATTQKLGFWNKAPIVQPTTAVTAATFVANTSGIANDTATFDGYTIGKVVAALRNVGILA